jgi:serine/threonine protein kinase
MRLASKYAGDATRQGTRGRGRTRKAVDSGDTLIVPRPPMGAPRPPLGAPRPPLGAPELLLGRYRPLERLGEGGFGVVWRAHDEQLGREVAIKRVHYGSTPANTAGPSPSAARARREALAAARLSHPAIAALYEARDDGDCLYLVSELVRGADLARHIAARSLGERRIVEIGVALSEALEHAHSRGVVHRDVKPANVVVLEHAAARSAHAPAKLTDFGSALVSGVPDHDGVALDGLTRTGDIVGTLAYMAPEQSEGRRATEQTDLYALALVLYEALAGVNPVRGRSTAATASRIGSVLPSLGSHCPDLPRTLVSAIDAALAPQAGERGTLSALRRSLETALRRGPRPWPSRAERSERDRRGERTEPDLRADRRRAEHPTDQARAGRSGASRMALPRVLWWAGALAAIAWQAAAGRPGVAALLAAIAAPLALLPRRSAPGWLAAALAPALGTIGLAGAFPALAGQRARWRARAATGALGYWWLLLAQPLVARVLWLWPPGSGGAPLPSGWGGSLARTGTDVLGPLLVPATLAGAAVWALAAAGLPLLVRGRGLVRDALGAIAWAAALAAAEPVLDAGAGALHGSTAAPRGAIASAAVGAALAICACAFRPPRPRPE